MVILRVMIGRVAACRFASGWLQMLRGGAGEATLAPQDAAGGGRGCPGGRVRSEQWVVGPRDRARMEGAGKPRIVRVGCSAVTATSLYYP